MTWIYLAEYRTDGDVFARPVALYRQRLEDPDPITESYVDGGGWSVDESFAALGLNRPGRVVEQVSADYAQAVLGTWRHRTDTPDAT